MGCKCDRIENRPYELKDGTQIRLAFAGATVTLTVDGNRMEIRPSEPFSVSLQPGRSITIKVEK